MSFVRKYRGDSQLKTEAILSWIDFKFKPIFKNSVKSILITQLSIKCSATENEKLRLDRYHMKADTDQVLNSVYLSNCAIVI